MSRFTEARYELTGELWDKREEVILLSPLAYEVGFLGSGWVLEAPTGFRCDLCSMPLWTQRFRWGRRLRRKAARASIPHDLMRKDKRWPKLLGDYVFVEALRVDGVRWYWRYLIAVLVVLNFSRR